MNRLYFLSIPPTWDTATFFKFILYFFLINPNIWPDFSNDAQEQGSIQQLRATKQSTVQINTCFLTLGSFKESRIDVYCDASWDNLPDEVSSGQYQ